MYVVENVEGDEYCLKESMGKKSSVLARNEYNLLKELNHPNIPKVYEYYANDERTKGYMIMEYFKGFLALNEHVSENGTLNDNEIF